MRLIRKLDQVAAATAGGAVAIGNFDGVHRGHARIIERLVARARVVSGPATVFTFDPHPATILRPDAVPESLTWLERKTQLLGNLGVDNVIAYPTDVDILRLSPDTFFERIVTRLLSARAIVEGPNFFFGHNRAGSVDTLDRLCKEAGISLDVVEPLMSDGQIVSSSRIRKLVKEGLVREVNQLMTEPFRVHGPVVRGAGRGATIGFPTANLEPTDMVLFPAGVYAGRAILRGTTYPAAIHIGPNPTFNERRLKFETHVIGVQGQFYGEMLEVEFMERIRDIRPFENVEELKKQLSLDAETARERATCDTESP